MRALLIIFSQSLSPFSLEAGVILLEEKSSSTSSLHSGKSRINFKTIIILCFKLACFYYEIIKCQHRSKFPNVKFDIVPGAVPF